MKFSPNPYSKLIPIRAANDTRWDKFVEFEWKTAFSEMIRLSGGVFPLYNNPRTLRFSFDISIAVC